MRIRQRQLYYGGVIGTVAFLAGLGLTYVTVPPGEVLPEADPLRATVWIWLAAHFVEITGDTYVMFFEARRQVSTSTIPRLSTLRALPPVLVALAAVLVSEAVSRTRRPRYVLINASSVLVGYLGAAFLAFLLFDAQPGVSLYVWILLLGGAALAVGSYVVGRLTFGLPFIGFASLGGVILIGFLVIVGGVAVAQAVAPMVAVGVVGVLVGAIAQLAVRTYT